MSSLSSLAVTAGVIIAVVSCSVGAEDATPGKTVKPAPRRRRPEIWMCHGNPFALTAPDADAKFVLKHLAGVKLYIGTINKAPPEKLAALARLLKANDIQVSMECGGTLGFARLDDSNGERSARVALVAVDKFRKAGGKVHYLEMDGPVRRLLYPPRGRKGFTSIDRCAAELMDFIRGVKKAYPDMGFFLLTNFPNWGYRGDVSYHARGPKRQDWGDYDTVVKTVLAHAAKAKLKIDGVTVDNPYEYRMGQKVEGMVVCYNLFISATETIGGATLVEPIL
ncbi:hypothetical protein LCGC14_2849510 [marine sediment metagenome]|uniref:Uncharacterized protein n=1 Tax=marine sediment metagenome TaxID=412755 RepID=A0A0F8Y8Z0_9ZZZZ